MHSIQRLLLLRVLDFRTKNILSKNYWSNNLGSSHWFFDISFVVQKHFVQKKALWLKIFESKTFGFGLWPGIQTFLVLWRLAFGTKAFGPKAFGRKGFDPIVVQRHSVSNR